MEAIFRNKTLRIKKVPSNNIYHSQASTNSHSLSKYLIRHPWYNHLEAPFPSLFFLHFYFLCSRLFFLFSFPSSCFTYLSTMYASKNDTKFTPSPSQESTLSSPKWKRFYTILHQTAGHFSANYVLRRSSFVCASF